MNRFAALTAALLCAACVPSTALPAPALASSPAAVTGQIIALTPSGIALQTNGRQMGVANAMTRTADRLGQGNWPYVYAGGHAQAGVASIGMRGSGYNGRRKGFDCSGSVAAVLAGAGLWPAGGGVPSDAGVIQQLRQEHLIAPGAYTTPGAVNLWDDWGVHIFMSINGRFFGTSDGGGGNAKGGPAWLYDGAPDTYSRAYRPYHFLASVLRNRTAYGQSYAFSTYANPPGLAGAELGDLVRVSYRVLHNGSMSATAVAYPSAITISGTLSAIAADGSSVTVQVAANQPLVFTTSSVTALTQGLQVGDEVQVIYTRDTSGRLIPHAITVTSQPTPQSPTQPGPNPPGSPGVN